MSVLQKLAHELRALLLVGLYVTVWLGSRVVLKKLVLDEYDIGFAGMSAALMGALVLSKVVLILENVSLGAWVRSRPAWVEVVLRTVLYSFGVVVVLLLEKAFEGRHEHGGLAESLRSDFQHADIHHVRVNAICLGGALLSYNLLWVIRRNLGEGGLLRMLRMPLPDEPAAGGEGRARRSRHPEIQAAHCERRRPGTRSSRNGCHTRSLCGCLAAPHCRRSSWSCRPARCCGP